MNNNTITKQNFIFLGTKDVAKILNCSIPTARTLMHRKDFPLVKVGRALKVYAPALDEWARGHRI